VATRIENGIDMMQLGLAHNLRDRVANVGLLERLHMKMKRLADGMAADRRRLECIKDENRKQKLENSLFEKDQKLKDIRQRWFERLVMVRQQITTRELREAMQPYLPPGNELVVYTVSKKHSWAGKSYDKQFGPCLSEEQTGVLDLRRHVHLAVEPRMVAALQHFVDQEFQVFLDGVALLSDPVNLQASKEALELIEAARRDLDLLITEHHSEVSRNARQNLCDPSEDALREYVEQALEVVKKKRDWHWSTVKAFLYHSGSYKTNRRVEEPKSHGTGNSRNCSWQTLETTG
jgi:hypothetical protein